MAEITLNGIKYSNVNIDQSIVSNTGKNARSQFVTSNKIDTTKLTNIYNAVDSGAVQWSNMAFVNALEIDWNGADFDGAPGNNTPGTINTTGDLIKAIKWASTAGGRISDLSSGGIQIGKLTIQDNPSSDNNRIILGGYGSNKTVAYLEDIKTYKAGTGLSLNSTSLTFNHKNSITAGNTQVTGKTLTFGGTFNIPYVSYDAQGHINGTGVSTMTMPNIEGSVDLDYYSESNGRALLQIFSGHQ